MSKRNSTALVPAGADGAALALPAVGNLGAYISAVNRLPMLSVERKVELGRRLREHADLVVLTNLLDHRQQARTRQLAEHGIDLRVFTNQGPKGPALQAILDEYRPSRAIFIDDLAQHHGSVAQVAPHVGRLHLCAEPMLAPHIDCAHTAGHAHARIDSWSEALPWLLGKLYD